MQARVVDHFEPARGIVIGPDPVVALGGEVDEARVVPATLATPERRRAVRRRPEARRKLRRPGLPAHLPGKLLLVIPFHPGGPELSRAETGPAVRDELIEAPIGLVFGEIHRAAQRIHGRSLVCKRSESETRLRELSVQVALPNQATVPFLAR